MAAAKCQNFRIAVFPVFRGKTNRWSSRITDDDKAPGRLLLLKYTVIVRTTHHVQLASDSWPIGEFTSSQLNLKRDLWVLE